MYIATELAMSILSGFFVQFIFFTSNFQTWLLATLSLSVIDPSTYQFRLAAL